MEFLVCFVFLQDKRVQASFYYYLKVGKFSTVQYISAQQDAGCLYQAPGVFLCRKRANHVIYYESRGPPSLHLTL